MALFAAAINGAENDEIRLTNTVSYMGNGDGSTILTDWNGSGAGVLTIAGVMPTVETQQMTSMHF